MKRMTVVATPARTMAGSGGHCPDLYLECQIKGARVCVDTVTACDGVPNCGAWGKLLLLDYSTPTIKLRLFNEVM